MNTIRNLAMMLTAVLAGATSAFAQGSMHARVSHDAGSLLVKGSGAADWSYATTNAIVLPGDTLWIDETGVGEIELPQGSFLRLADSSKVDVVSLDPTVSLRAWNGSFYVQRIARSSGNVVFETPAATVDISPDTSVRIDVLGSGSTTVTVRWGSVGVRTPGGAAVSVGAGRRVYVDPGLLPSNPVQFDRNVEDSFDQWSRERSEYIATGGNVPAEVTVAPATLGVSDLNHYGEWVYVDHRPYWRPTIVTNYVPYRTGYWNYVPAYGHVWVGTTPFCYVTSHYGRWSYMNNYGWCWSYDPVWRPAWAVTVRYGDYFAWAPCDYYNRPVLVTDSAYFNIGGVRFSVSSTSWVGHNNLYQGPRYVSPWYSNPYYNHHHGPDTVVNINIWNIDGRNNRPEVNPFQNDRFTVRDYNPSRSIRGVQSLDNDGRSALDRAQRLENSYGRSQFASAPTRRGDSRTRTGYERSSREADVRQVRVQDRGPTAFTRSDSHDASRDRGRGVNDTTTINNGMAARTDVRPLNRVERGESSSPRQSAPSASRDVVRSERAPERTAIRGERENVRGNDSSSGRETVRGADVNRETTRTAPRVETSRPQPERTRVDYQPRSESRDRTTEVPRNEAVNRAPERSRTTIETPPAPRVTRSESFDRSPSVRYSAPAPSSRESAPRVSVTPRVERSAPAPTPQPTIRQQVSAPSYSAPRVERAPQRDNVRVQPSAPAPEQRPSVSYSRPERSSVQYSAPSVNPRGGGAVNARPQGVGRGDAGRGR